MIILYSALFEKVSFLHWFPHMGRAAAGQTRAEVISMSQESAYFRLGSISGAHAVKALKKGLDTLPGVTSVSVNEAEGRMAVDYDGTGVNVSQLEKKIRELGYAIDALSIDQLTD